MLSANFYDVLLVLIYKQYAFAAGTGGKILVSLLLLLVSKIITFTHGY